MHLLILQHEVAEHPGIYRSFLKDDGHSYDVVSPATGDPLPALDPYDGLWVMGGPMQVWEEQEHPWLIPEKALIRDAVVTRHMPYFGICLGHQLLADALGGKVGLSATPELGVMEVERSATENRFLDGLAPIFSTLQWHEAEVTELPEGARVLARSPACAIQAMGWGGRAFSSQFHSEAEADTIASWLDIPGCRETVTESLGAEGPEKLVRDVADNLDRLNRSAKRLYDNWMEIVAQG